MPENPACSRGGTEAAAAPRDAAPDSGGGTASEGTGRSPGKTLVPAPRGEEGVCGPAAVVEEDEGGGGRGAARTTGRRPSAARSRACSTLCRTDLASSLLSSGVSTSTVETGTLGEAEASPPPPVVGGVVGGVVGSDGDASADAPDCPETGRFGSTARTTRGSPPAANQRPMVSSPPDSPRPTGSRGRGMVAGGLSDARSVLAVGGQGEAFFGRTAAESRSGAAGAPLSAAASGGAVRVRDSGSGNTETAGASEATTCRGWKFRSGSSPGGDDSALGSSEATTGWESGIAPSRGSSIAPSRRNGESTDGVPEAGAERGAKSGGPSGWAEVPGDRAVAAAGSGSEASSFRSTPGCRGAGVGD